MVSSFGLFTRSLMRQLSVILEIFYRRLCRGQNIHMYRVYGHNVNSRRNLFPMKKSEIYRMLEHKLTDLFDLLVWSWYKGAVIHFFQYEIITFSSLKVNSEVIRLVFYSHNFFYAFRRTILNWNMRVNSLSPFLASVFVRHQCLKQWCF
jgi:hypothetical protein